MRRLTRVSTVCNRGGLEVSGAQPSSQLALKRGSRRSAPARAIHRCAVCQLVARHLVSIHVTPPSGVTNMQTIPDAQRHALLSEIGSEQPAVLAAKYGISRSYVYCLASRYGKRAGMAPVIPKRPWSKQEIEQLRQLAGTKSANDIAEIMQRSVASVKGQAVKMEVSLRCFGEANFKAKHSNHDVELWRQLYEEGLTVPQIAEKFEASQGTIRDVVSFRTRLHG